MPEEEVISQETVEEPTAEPVELEDSGTSEPDETVESQGEVESQPETEERKPGKGYQKRIDELVREREDWKRQAQGLQEVYKRQSYTTPEPKPVEAVYPDLPKPKSDDFETYDDYVEALTDYKTEVKIRQVQNQNQVQSKAQVLQGWHEQAKGKYQDWQDVFNGDVPVTDFMGEVLLQSDNGIDLAYYLGKNPAEARRIYNMPQSYQAYALGKLDAKLASAPPPQRNKTGAPAPTSPVGGKETPTKKLEDMDYDEYKSYREKQLGWRK